MRTSATVRGGHSPAATTSSKPTSTSRCPAGTTSTCHVFSSPVTVEGVEGSLKLHSFSSRLALDNVVGPVSGQDIQRPVSIREKSWAANQTIQVETFSGGIDLRLPDEAQGSVTFNSFSGRTEFRAAAHAPHIEPAQHPSRARRRRRWHPALQDVQRQRQNRPVIRQTTDTIGGCPPARAGRHALVSTAVEAESDVRREPRTPSAARIATEGKFLRLAETRGADTVDERFLVKGVTYGTFAPDAQGYQFPPLSSRSPPTSG